MGLTKREMERKEEEANSKEVKECKRCFSSISLAKYEENNGLCDYCMQQWEKMQNE